MQQPQRATNFTTILNLLMKEYRLERNMHQAVLAENMGKSASAITKVEAGDINLQMNFLFAYCRAFGIAPSALLAAAERYMALFINLQWQIASNAIPKEQDALLQEAKEYYSSDYYKKRFNSHWSVPVLNGPLYREDGTVAGLDVFLFALYPTYKEQLLKQSTMPVIF